MALLPGIYLRKRREASGQSVEEVASMIATEPRLDERGRIDWLTRIEAGELPIGHDTIRSLRFAFPFDACVLRRLDDLARGAKLPEPRLCRVCACSQADPCEPPCAWVGDQDLCTACPGDGEPGVQAEPIDDEEPAAAPSPDNDQLGAGAAA